MQKVRIPKGEKVQKKPTYSLVQGPNWYRELVVLLRKVLDNGFATSLHSLLVHSSSGLRCEALLDKSSSLKENLASVKSTLAQYKASAQIREGDT